MFNEKDFENINKMQNTMADGITDGLDSHLVLEEIVNIMSETDFTSDESRMELMMKCINLCYSEDYDDTLNEDNVFSVVLGLCFNYSNIISNLIVDGFNIDEYYHFLQNEVLPVMKKESTHLPYWNTDD